MSFRRRPVASRTPTTPTSSSSISSTSTSSKPTTTQWPGTAGSAHGAASVLVSTGAESLDAVLGGGLAVGSLTLLKEDRLTGYARLLRNLFVAQGLASTQFVCVACADDADPTTSLRQLMAVVPSRSSPHADHDQPHQDAMRIAWRYQGLPTVGAPRSTPQPHNTSPTAAPFSSVFDLTRTIDRATIDRALESQIAIINAHGWASHFLAENDVLSSFRTTAAHHAPPSTATVAARAGESDAQTIVKQRPYVRLLEHLSQVLREFRLTENPRGVLRICITSLASPAWFVGDQSEHQQTVELFSFLHTLRTMLRDCAAVCLVSIPAYLYGDQYPIATNPAITQLSHACDLVMELESFSGSLRPTNKQYEKMYHGLLHLRKLPRIGALQATALLQRPTTGMVELASLGFNVRRKRFLVETIHLPPEDDDDANADGTGIVFKKERKPKRSGDNSGGIEIAFENSNSSNSDDSTSISGESDNITEFANLGGRMYGDVEDESSDQDDFTNDDDDDDEGEHVRTVRRAMQRGEKAQRAAAVQSLDF